MVEEWLELKFSGAKNVDRMRNIGMFGISKERNRKDEQIVDKKRECTLVSNCLPRRVRKLTGSRRDAVLIAISQRPLGAGR